MEETELITQTLTEIEYMLRGNGFFFQRCVSNGLIRLNVDFDMIGEIYISSTKETCFGKYNVIIGGENSIELNKNEKPIYFYSEESLNNLIQDVCFMRISKTIECKAFGFNYENLLRDSLRAFIRKYDLKYIENVPKQYREFAIQIQGEAHGFNENRKTTEPEWLNRLQRSDDSLPF